MPDSSGQNITGMLKVNSGGPQIGSKFVEVHMDYCVSVPRDPVGNVLDLGKALSGQESSSESNTHAGNGSEREFD